MLTEKEKKMCRMLIGGYKKKLKKYVSRNTTLPAAYEILREKGLTEADGMKAYDAMCAFLRKFASLLYKGADLLSNGYQIVR